MANVVKYSTSSVPNTIKVGNLVFGTEDVDYGPTSSTGFYAGIDPPIGGYILYSATSGNTTPSIVVANNDAELVYWAKAISNTNVTTIEGALSYFIGTNSYAVHNINNPGIVTNGLILYLNAGIASSYPMTGTTWYDLSGNENHGTINNGEYYSAYLRNNGNVSNFFSIDVSNSTSINNTFSVTTGGWTIEEIIWTNSLTYPEADAGSVVSNNGYGSGAIGFDWQRGTGTDSFRVEMSDGVNYDDIGILIPSPYNQLNIWRHRTMIWNRSSNKVSIYIDGIFIGEVSSPNTSGESIYDGGGISFGTLYGWKHFGRRSVIKIYNRVLSSAEILQNYYASYYSQIATDGLVLSLDAGDIRSFKGEPTTNLATNTMLNGGWCGSYSLINSNTKTFDLVIPYCSNHSAWTSYWYNVSNYVGQILTISAYFQVISETNSTFSDFTIGQGNLEIYPYHIRGSDLTDRLTVTSKSLQFLSWTGLINAAGIMGFTLWVGNAISGANVTVRVSNVQIESKSYATPFTTGTRGTTVATGGGWADLSGKGNHGELVNSPTFSSDNSGCILCYSGSYIDCGKNVYDLGIRRIATFSGWMTSVDGSMSYLLSDYNSVGMTLRFNSTTSADFYVYGNNHIITSSYSFVPNSWYYIVGVMDGDNMYMYINGVLVGTAVLGEDIGSSPSTLKIGTRGDLPSSTNQKVAIVKVHNRAFSATDALLNYNLNKSRFGL